MANPHTSWITASIGNSLPMAKHNATFRNTVAVAEHHSVAVAEYHATVANPLTACHPYAAFANT